KAMSLAREPCCQGALIAATLECCSNEPPQWSTLQQLAHWLTGYCLGARFVALLVSRCLIRSLAARATACVASGSRAPKLFARRAECLLRFGRACGTSSVPRRVPARGGGRAGGRRLCGPRRGGLGVRGRLPARRPARAPGRQRAGR